MQLNKNSVLKFWAKTSPSPDKSNAFHPLICHLIDITVVAKKIWAEVLPKAAKKRIAKQFAETEITDEILEKIGRSVAFIAGLHDLGKMFAAISVARTLRKREGRLKNYWNSIKKQSFGKIQFHR